jgi:long-subunit acyl-CoA synthetase (AMP-forming)
LGLGGKHVAVMGDVHPAYTTTYLAVVNGNGVIVPLDKEIGTDQINSFFEFTEAEALVYTGAMNKSIAEIDDYLFDKYNIPENVREFVKKNIQTRTEANILNFPVKEEDENDEE